jgi:hypothetical protein
MPHEFYYVKNKERRDRRMTNLMFRNHERMLKGLKKLKKAEEQLSRHEPLYPQILRKLSQLRAAAS